MGMSDTRINPLGNEAKLAQKTIVIKDGDAEFEFKIPTILDEVKIGARMRRLRMMADPMDDPGGTVDMDTLAYLKSMAFFDVLLVAADNAQWAWSKGLDGRRTVNSTEFPEDKTNQVLRVAGNAIVEVNRFRDGRIADAGAASVETVAD